MGERMKRILDTTIGALAAAGRGMMPEYVYLETEKPAETDEPGRRQ